MKLRPLTSFMVTAVVVWAAAIAPFQPAATAAANDTLLEMIPADVVFCVRINQFNTALGRMDQYLAGASPVPVSLIMLANMQLAGIVGDPALTGIDRNGTFSLVGFVSETGVEMAVLAPVTSYEEFIQNPACSATDRPNLTLLSAPSSPVGPLAIMPAPSGQFALVGPEFDQDNLLKVHQRLAAGGAKLASRLDVEQVAQATAAPAWAFVNVAHLYDLFGPMAIEGIGSIMAEMPEGEAFSEMFEQGLPVLSEAVQLFWGQADALTLALTPEPSVANLDITFRAKNGSELGGMLVADPQGRPGFMLAGYADDAAAINAVIKNNRPLVEKLFKKFANILEANSNDKPLPEGLDQLFAYMEKAIGAMGSETFFSYNYTAGFPPFMMRQAQHTSDPSFYKEGLQEGFAAANSFYAGLDLPINLQFDQQMETYKTIQIDRFQMIFSNDQDDDELDILTQMYGQEGFTYYMAQKDDLIFTTFGPNAVNDIKSMIDTTSAAAPAGELQKAITILGPTARQADMLVSVNYLKLVKGLMGTVAQTVGPMGMGDMFSMMAQAMDIQTQSCMAAGIRIADGKIASRVALPKQHLTEIITAAMQIQQHITQQQMAMMQSQGGMGGGMMGGMAGQPESTSPFAAPTPPAAQRTDPLQAWVGQPTPDLKMTDLQGNAVSLADLKGKKIVLDFWATWCPPCKDMIPDLIALRQSYATNQLVILGISNEPIDRLNKFAKDYQMNYPVVPHSGPMPDPYSKVTGLPTTFFIDSTGVIRHVLVGYHEKAEIKAAIDSLQ